jgi:hypothetical protein
MPFSIRPFRRFPIHCSVTYNAGLFLKLLRASCLGFGSLITLLVLSSGPAYAEWVGLAHTEGVDGFTVYVDLDTIRHKGEPVKIWALRDYKTIRTGAGGLYLSGKDQREYNCAEERTRVLAFTEFSGNMGNGNVVHSNSVEGKWEPVIPGSIDQGLWKLACAKQ